MYVIKIKKSLQFFYNLDVLAWVAYNKKSALHFYRIQKSKGYKIKTRKV